MDFHLPHLILMAIDEQVHDLPPLTAAYVMSSSRNPFGHLLGKNDTAELRHAALLPASSSASAPHPFAHLMGKIEPPPDPRSAAKAHEPIDFCVGATPNVSPFSHLLGKGTSDAELRNTKAVPASPSPFMHMLGKSEMNASKARPIPFNPNPFGAPRKDVFGVPPPSEAAKPVAAFTANVGAAVAQGVVAVPGSVDVKMAHSSAASPLPAAPTPFAHMLGKAEPATKAKPVPLNPNPFGAPSRAAPAATTADGPASSAASSGPLASPAAAGPTPPSALQSSLQRAGGTPVVTPTQPRLLPFNPNPFGHALTNAQTADELRQASKAPTTHHPSAAALAAAVMRSKHSEPAGVHLEVQLCGRQGVDISPSRKAGVVLSSPEAELDACANSPRSEPLSRQHSCSPTFCSQRMYSDGAIDLGRRELGIAKSKSDSDHIVSDVPPQEVRSLLMQSLACARLRAMCGCMTEWALIPRIGLTYCAVCA
jgi:hypothetical protein